MVQVKVAFQSTDGLRKVKVLQLKATRCPRTYKYETASFELLLRSFQSLVPGDWQFKVASRTQTLIENDTDLLKALRNFDSRTPGGSLLLLAYPRASPCDCESPSDLSRSLAELEQRLKSFIEKKFEQLEKKILSRVDFDLKKEEPIFSFDPSSYEDDDDKSREEKDVMDIYSSSECDTFVHVSQHDLIRSVDSLAKSCEAELSYLDKLGFKNRELNAMLLRCHNMDLHKTVKCLTELLPQTHS